MKDQLPTGRSRHASFGHRDTDEHSSVFPDPWLGAPATRLGELLGDSTPRQLRRFLFQSQLSSDLSKRRSMLGLATEMLGDLEDGGDNPASLLADLRAELELSRALLDLAEDRLAQARGHLRTALDEAEDGTGDVVLLGQIHEAVAQLAWLTDGPAEAELRLRPALDLYREAEQQPELASALFRAAAWRLEQGEPRLGLEPLRAALDSLALDALLADERSGAWEAVRRFIGSSERGPRLWAPLCFAVAQELAAVELAEPLRRRVAGEAWALAALATLAQGGDAPDAGKMLTRAERCLLRDGSVSRRVLESVAAAFRQLLCEPELAGSGSEELAWVSAVLEAAAEPGRPPASLWSSAIDDGELDRAVFEPPVVG